MNLSATIVGILAALLALVLVGVATAAGALLSLVQAVTAPAARTARKPTNNSTEARSGKDVEAMKMPQGRRSVEEFRSAA